MKQHHSIGKHDQQAPRSHHWGELISKQSPPKAMSVVDMDSPSLNPKSIDLEGPHLHQPSSHHKTSAHQPLPSELVRPDAISIHTIQLFRNNRRIRTIIAASQQLQQESSKWEDRSHRPRLQSLPATPLLLLPSKKIGIPASDNSGQNGHREDSSFCRPKMHTSTVEVDEVTSRKLRRRAIATLCAHAGYEMSQESAVETLADVLQEYLIKVCKLLRAAVDREALTGSTGFQDSLSQVLQESGVGSTDTLFKFWKTRIKDYHKAMQKRNTQLREQYDKLRNPGDVPMSGDSKSPRVKEEPFVDIQFPDSEQDSSEVTPDATEHPNQPLNFQSLSNMELEEQTRATTSITEDENHWYPPTYVKTEAVTEASTNKPDDGRDLETQEHSDQGEEEMDTSQSSRSPAVVVDVDVTSPQSRSNREIAPMNPKKKKKK
ncbi:STAGA complex 65 subunit gamma-like [Asterias rubens]|uniref:STAGA complex 65 subunit gamma-like n=1 Tax=Asterias rubens TaxID=7604 RepID=UPI001455103F|nr:STAGA complex 65 subunit gamma-like [Asterias rubens]